MALNVALIGTGFGQHAVAPVYESLGCSVAVVSPRDEAGVQAAIASPCDLVSIHSPPFMHLAHVTLATESGRHVLCDKPFGRNAIEAQQMLDMASAAGVLHFLNFEFRFDPLREKMKALLDNGAIGEPVHFSSTMFTSGGHDRPYGWLFDKDKGGGWIGAFASHEIDTIQWLFGNVDSLGGQRRIDIKQRPDRDESNDTLHTVSAEDAITAWLRLKNGVTAEVNTAFCAAVNLPAQLTLLGTEGAIQITQNSDLVLLRPNREPEHFSAAPANNALMPALESWLGKVCHAVETRQPIEPNFATGVACAEVIDAMRALDIA